MSLPVRPQLYWCARPLRISLRMGLGLVAVIAVILGFWKEHRQANVLWHRTGGMIGWSQTRIVAGLGQPRWSVERKAPDPGGQDIWHPSGPRSFRTLFFETNDGNFVAWLSSEGGAYTCFRSTWVEKGCYY
jgi:hypothetical protein